MTSDEMVEAMARGIYEAKRAPTDKTWDEYCADKTAQQWGVAHYRSLARAAIRACHEAGGLVLREVPGDERIDGARDSAAQMLRADGHNAALAAVRAAAVEEV